MKKNIIITIFILVLVIILIGCTIGTNDTKNDPDDHPNNSDNNADDIIIDEDGMDEYIDDGVEFNNAYVTDDDILVIDVTYSGGCVDHGFVLVWNGSYMESYPPQINLFLFHDFNDDPCDGIVNDTLYYNFDFDAPLYVHIRNGQSYAEEDTITVEYGIN
jgi:hypothetical protein